MYQSCAFYDENSKKIYLCCTTEKGLTGKYIYKELGNKLPQYMLPSYVKILDEMLLNLNGKIDREKLKKRIITAEK